MKFRRLIFSSIALSLVLFSCDSKTNDLDKETASTEKGAGTFSIAFEVAPKSMNPRTIMDYYSAIAANQVYEGLVKFNPKTLKPEPAIANNFNVSDDSKTLTFELRDDVWFHDSKMFPEGKGRKVTPEDVKKTFEYYCSPNVKGTPIAYLNIFKDAVIGANEFNEEKADEISGIKIDGNKVIIELKVTDVNFINKLCMVNAVVLPKEAIENNTIEDGIGSGPFILKQFNSKKVVFVKNPKYYKKNEAGNQLPLLDSVEFVIDNRKENQLSEFRNKNLNIIIGLPPSQIVDVLEKNIKDFTSNPPKYISKNNPEFSTSYISLNLTKPIFKDPRVRRALSMAIDRDEIIQKELGNQAYSTDGTYGVTPPLKRILKGYDLKGIQDAAANYNPEMAKKLLAEAGYPNGKGFPSIKLEFSEGKSNSKVANNIMRQLNRNLNINIQIEAVTFAQKIANSADGKGHLYLDSWIADYASPQTFLSNYYGDIIPSDPNEPSPLNITRYDNETFNKAYEEACSSKDAKQRLAKFAEAEKELMKDGAAIVLWYKEQQTLIHANVQGLSTNPLKIFDFTNVYFEDPKPKDLSQNK